MIHLKLGKCFQKADVQIKTNPNSFQTNLTSLEGLAKYIDPSQLTSDLEGTLAYDHSIWIEMRCVSAIKFLESINLNFALENLVKYCVYVGHGKQFQNEKQTC